MGYAQKVVFDFDGALQMARKLSRTSAAIAALATTRRGLADTALVDWVGAFGKDFDLRASTELRNATDISNALRFEADEWALQWKNAMDQENANRWARECDRIRDSRSNWSSAWGGVFGHDDLPGRPNEADVPSAANNYLPTRSFVWY